MLEVPVLQTVLGFFLTCFHLIDINLHLFSFRWTRFQITKYNRYFSIRKILNLTEKLQSSFARTINKPENLTSYFFNFFFGFRTKSEFTSNRFCHNKFLFETVILCILSHRLSYISKKETSFQTNVQRLKSMFILTGSFSG